MKKILNTPDLFVQDTMEGIALAHPDKVALLDDDFRVLVSKYPTSEGKVGIVTGGGSGHLPLFLGYVGEGMLDGCAVGEVFASPSAEKMAEMIRACDRGAGVVCLFGNYNGDLFNFRMAMEDVEFDDIETRAVVVGDDVASSPAESADKRRGVAGIVYAYKVAGAAATEGRDLDAVVEVTRKALDNIRTMGVALTPTIVPKVGKPGFTIADDEIEIGMGIHGEAGIEVRKMMRADEIAELIVGTIERDMPLTSGDRVSVLINGLGGTPLEEQYIVYRAVHRLLLEQDVHVVMPHIGEFATSMEMAGLSVTLFKLDDELETLLRAPARTPFYTNLNK
ncbi:dihydroxyacetone kinase subunit DhaK [Trueperella pyogenes]|uniref:dihydroxyacetone kinase subunit DhaK n=1 Tax=Trueperella pyogenes TaxID=1661 RepID=UPI00043ADF0F|nr:dihydroxyacetone kinase subunit DhaK [Trueperella pyogenes]AHU89688.1 dihydroxyacetone kinase [Trueperella pyogenes]OQD36925.1 dihydroxyacetone kinase subunit DhaK [Trueperella pyogenes]UVJ57602.1 dihydroxyacetone kinase subunit DhaK [Trueperella pyogenes]